MSHESAMNAPLTAEQARERLRAELSNLYSAEALSLAASELRHWRAVNIGKRRVWNRIAEASNELHATAARIETLVYVLTREQPAPLTWIERLRAWATGGPSL